MSAQIICPVNPPGHDWRNGLACRWCEATRTAGEAIVSGLASRRGGTEDSARALLDAYRAEILAEAVPADSPAIDELRRLVRAAAPLWGAASRYCDADINAHANRLYLAIRAEILDGQTTEAESR